MIREMHAEDCEEVANIFAESREASRWSAKDIAQLRATGAKVWVALENGRVAGAVSSREVAGEAEILNLAVGKQWRRKGFGRSLMETALDDATTNGVQRVYLEVRESNIGARAFYERLGFSQDGRRRHYYQDPPEDALVFSRKC